MNKQEITIQVKEKSKELGFDLVGITKPHIIKNKLLDVWLNKNNHASMQWIKNRSEERKNIYSYFPEIKSVISFGYNYYTGENNLNDKDFKISNYAWGNDYHIVLKNKLTAVLGTSKLVSELFGIVILYPSSSQPLTNEDILSGDISNRL